ncbi:SGNH/GDSL hydrolase family protein [Acidocella aminolytica]|uniref:Hydrolase n=1 Tax=Acidocella aminolytica 101 = DSM 11237 TaxID=1120923 RepID=A0A0D6PKU7_9PROT|nr:SGNH/GDSL hydrolase family protein [Acidocella aminolytica]GAN81823.1 hydrolase [Acidocella aminolytica 101 = DSM 11237]GBQ39161.1 lysophospholipase L1 [Acidocella aminolytica 101 = DSM 11237]SHF57854.1 Lysophospholipase L1 [Acidocella aminolytica 101 = DSM 11237]
MTDTAKRILCFGDSLTWGWVPVPDGVPSTRYPYAQRWTGAMAAALGADYEIIEEGLNGRTTAVADPVDPRLDGSAYLPSALASHMPLDLTIIMLGTNDAKRLYNRSAYEIAVGMQKLVLQVRGSAGGVGTAYPAPKVLVVAPPPLVPSCVPWFTHMMDGGQEKSAALAQLYKDMAAFMKAEFFDAGRVTQTGGIDGIHLTAANNAALGQALAGKVKEILG